MGEAHVAKARKAQAVLFDFAAPKHRILRADALAMVRESNGTEARTDDGTIDQRRVLSRATCSVIVFLVEAAYPSRMRPKDGEDYDIWLEAMHEIDEEEPANGLARYQVAMTRGDLEWLAGHLKNDGLGVPTGMVQWRQAVRRYIEALLADSETTNGAGA